MARKDTNSIINDLLKESRKLAKRANQRMVRLERAAEQPRYKHVVDYAHKTAQRDIAGLDIMLGKPADLTGKARFRESGKRIEGLSDKQMIAYLRTQISAEKQFLEAASSTIGDVYEGGAKIKGGYQSVMDRRTETINKKYGTDFTTDELQRFFNSRKQAKLQEMYGSDQMFTIANKIKEVPTTKKDMKDYIKKNISFKDLDIDTSDYKDAKDMFSAFKDFMELTGDPVLDEFVAGAVKGGFSIKNLFALFI